MFIALTVKNIVTDYRDVYVGTYTCRRIYKHINARGTALTSDTTTSTLSVQKASTDSLIIVGISEGNYSMKLITPNIVDTTWAGIWGGFFASDSIFINLVPGHAPFAYYYVGKKN